MDSSVKLQPGHGRTVVVGAGPAGLTAALELGRLGIDGVVFEADEVVGGISRSVVFQGCRMDIGGHRFYTKVPEVEALWKEILGSDLLVRRRLSRIFYRDRFSDYPLRPVNALRSLGIVESMRIVASYLHSDQLTEVLSRCGVDLSVIDHVVTSADRGLGKADGLLAKGAQWADGPRAVAEAIVAGCARRSPTLSGRGPVRRCNPASTVSRASRSTSGQGARPSRSSRPP